MKVTADAIKEWFIGKYDLECYNALQDWYLAPEQQHKTVSSIEEVWGEAWLACTKQFLGSCTVEIKNWNDHDTK